MSYELKTLVDDRGEAAKEDLLRTLKASNFSIDKRIGAGIEAILDIDPLKYAYTGENSERYWNAVKSALTESGYSWEEATIFVKACYLLHDNYGDIVAQMIEDSFIPGAEIEISDPPPQVREYMRDDNIYMFTLNGYSYDPEDMWEKEVGAIDDFQPKEIILPAFVAPLYLTMFSISLLGDPGGGDILDTIAHHLKKAARKINRAWRKTKKFIKKLIKW
ncbi:hypothetical protein ACRARG_00665 [Pseudooceanicola sp. C21-150M6]|uniref:hypothetical protein n=1 Tax=Pseudooceanicola sp. C21-150M6 TaxID=3434355 RepID=UPI003D7F6539